MPWIRNKPVRVVMRWQLIVTATMAVVFGLSWGGHGVASALMGGAISVISAAVFAVIASGYRGSTAGGVLITALKAEAAKILVMIVLLWLVMTFYENVVTIGFIGTFALTVLVFGMALFVRDDTRNPPRLPENPGAVARN